MSWVLDLSGEDGQGNKPHDAMSTWDHVTRVTPVALIVLALVGYVDRSNYRDEMDDTRRQLFEQKQDIAKIKAERQERDARQK